MFLPALMFAVSGCDDDPFKETQTGRNVLGFYLNGVPYMQIPRTIAIPPAVPPAEPWFKASFYESIQESAGDNVSRYQFSVYAHITPKNEKRDNDGFDIRYVHINLFDTLPFTTGVKYYFAEHSIYETPSNEENYLYYRFTKNTSNVLYQGVNDKGYVEFTKFDLNNRIVSGRFEAQITKPTEDASGEIVQQITKGVFDVRLQ
jgi:hypothetical protein